MSLRSAIAVDAIAILIFALVGRSNHAESMALVGVFRTAWPFLVGAAAGSLAGRTWRRPAALTSGVWVWVGALVLGMFFRWLSGGGIQLSFVIVAGTVLAVFLIGWRGALSLIRRAVPRSRHSMH